MMPNTVNFLKIFREIVDVTDMKNSMFHRYCISNITSKHIKLEFEYLLLRNLCENSLNSLAVDIQIQVLYVYMFIYLYVYKFQ